MQFELKQEQLEVEIKSWIGDLETRYSVIFRTKDSSVIHSLSRQQLKLLKEEVNKFNF